ncbi:MULTISPECIES: protein translocase subunit SecF [Brevibacterium]|mgnify:CR=1 FL=1|uniref:Protein translocase subunit SecF n=1 Tax=Brevibacterium salitolerans TaxID=1403566 RepID=A0ABP5I268_9MICO|nr:protein translocase subunit SecF [Brevibacterium sp.]
MKRFLSWGNRLHSGETSIPFVPRRGLWLGISGLLCALSLVIPLVSGFNLGIAFTGGSQFQVDNVTSADPAVGEEAVREAVGDENVSAVAGSDTSVSVTSDELTDAQVYEARQALVNAYSVEEADVTSTFVGPQWGQDVTVKMMRALVIFVALAMIVMAVYFRTWKMSLAAIVGVVAVMLITVGIYSATGFEVTPAAIIGFLTVLSFSIYDTVVVFDKVRENTAGYRDNVHMKFSELVNLGINQTTVRSINTSMISALPIGAILFIGVFMLGAGTLVDISLSLFIGQIVAGLSTLFVAAPLYAVLRAREPAVKEQEAAVAERRRERGLPDRPPVLMSEAPVSAGR